MSFVHRPRRSADLGVILLAFLFHVTFAAARLNGLPLSSRGISGDASCPDGWLCQQQICNLACPAGEICIQFEGTAACAPAKSQWCALNPNTFQAVECQDGICCHGNCYQKQAVCCDNPGVQCKIGELCNACAAGQTCQIGATTCVGGGSGPSSINNPTSASTMSSHVTQSATTLTSTTKSVVTSSKSPTISQSQPSHPVTSPTVVPQVSSYKAQGCYQDSGDSRVLVADSTTDANGMTVEKCVAFAQNNNWQYAGVEFGTECHVGNSLHDAVASSDVDCNQPCIGNGAEVCGAGNRIEIYQDTTWTLPNQQQLVDALNKYNQTIASALDAITKYRSDLQKYQNDGGPAGGAGLKGRRAGPALTAILRVDLENIHGDFTTLKQIQASITDIELIIQRLFQIAAQVDLPKVVQPKLVTDVILKVLDDNVLSATTATVDKIIQSAQGVDAIIEPALQQDVAAVIDVATEAAVASAVITDIGVGRLAGAATGILGTIATLLAHFLGSSGNNPPPQSLPPSQTTQHSQTTTKTTSTSSTCTMTATPTPIIVVMTVDTTAGQYQQFVDSLPKTSKPMTFPLIDGAHPWLLATLDQCTAEALWDNLHVQAMAIDNYLVANDDVDPITVLPKNPDELATKKHTVEQSAQTDSFGGTYNFTQDQPKGLLARATTLSAQSHIVAQTNGPAHLNWLSGLSRQSKLDGNFYNFENYMYDDGANLPLPTQPWAYYIDGSGFAIHSDYADKIGLHSAAFTGYAGSGEQGLIPDSDHGTSMASLTAGAMVGPAKNAKLGLIRLKSNSAFYSPISSTMLAFDTILTHSIRANSRGRSVVGMSFSAPTQLLWWPAPSRSPPLTGLLDGTDVFGVKLKDLYVAGIAAVKSAGNLGERTDTVADLSFGTPTRNGGTNTPLIVVGNNHINNQRYRTSQIADSTNKGILSIYAVGVDTVAAVYDRTSANTAVSQNKFRLLQDKVTPQDFDENGTSQAAAITTGVIASLLADPTLRGSLVAGGIPNFAMAVKKLILDMARDNKGMFPDGTPRLSNGISIPCPGPGMQGRPGPQLEDRPPPNQQGLTPVYQEVANGQTITFPALPLCYDLS